MIPANVTLRRELNEVEQENIAEAITWSHGRRHNPVSAPFCKNLHRRMFSRVWRWAGSYRDFNTNIGCDQTMPRHEPPSMFRITVGTSTTGLRSE